MADPIFNKEQLKKDADFFSSGLEEQPLEELPPEDEFVPADFEALDKAFAQLPGAKLREDVLGRKVESYFQELEKQKDVQKFSIKLAEESLKKARSPQEAKIIQQQLDNFKKKIFADDDEAQYLVETFKDVIFNRGNPQELGRFLINQKDLIEKKYPIAEFGVLFKDTPVLREIKNKRRWEDVGEFFLKQKKLNDDDIAKRMLTPFFNYLKGNIDITTAQDIRDDEIAKKVAKVDQEELERGASKLRAGVSGFVIGSFWNTMLKVGTKIGLTERSRQVFKQARRNLKLTEERFVNRSNPLVAQIGNLVGNVAQSIGLFKMAGGLSRVAGVGKIVDPIQRTKWFKNVVKASPQAGVDIFNALNRGFDFASRGSLINAFQKSILATDETDEELKKWMGTLPEEAVSGFILGATDILGRGFLTRLAVGATVGFLDTAYRIKSRGYALEEEKEQLIFNVALSGLVNTMFTALRPIKVGGKTIYSAPEINEKDILKRIFKISKGLSSKFGLDRADVESRMKQTLDGFLGYGVSKTGLDFNKTAKKGLLKIVEQRSEQLGFDRPQAVKETKDLMKKLFDEVSKFGTKDYKGFEPLFHEVVNPEIGKYKGKETKAILDRVINSFAQNPEKRYRPFVKLNEKVATGKITVKEHNDFLQLAHSVLKKVSDANGGKEVTPEMADGFFKKNPRLWKIFSTDMERLNARLDMDSKPFAEIFKDQMAIEQKVQRADTIEAKKDSLIEFIKRTPKWTEDWNVDNFLNVEIKKRKGMAKYISKMLSVLGNKTRLKNQSAFTKFVNLDNPFYNMMLSGKMRWTQLFHDTFKQVFSELSEKDRQMYATVLDLYSRYANPEFFVNRNYKMPLVKYLEMRKDIRKTRYNDAQEISRHKGYVEDAIENGLPVPQEVLKNYPDLKTIKVKKKPVLSKEDVIRKSFKDLRDGAKNSEEVTEIENIIRELDEYLKTNPINRLWDFQNKIVNPINEAFTDMTKTFQKSKDFKPPLDLNFVIRRRLETPLNDLSLRLIDEFQKKGLIPTKDPGEVDLKNLVGDKGEINTQSEIRNMLSDPRLKQSSFVNSLQDDGIITTQNKSDVLPVINEYFRSRRALLQQQRGYNPLVIFDQPMDNISKNPLLSFVSKSPQLPRRATPTFTDLKHIFRIKDPSQIYAYRFSDYFYKLEQAYMFDTLSKMKIDVNGKRVPFLFRKKDIDKVRNEVGSKTFQENFKNIEPTQSKDLEGWVAKKEFHEVIEDLIDNKRRAGSFTKVSHFFKRRKLIKSYIMWKNDLIQMAIADPRALTGMMEAHINLKNNSLLTKGFERLDLDNAQIGVIDSVKRNLEDLDTFYKDSDALRKLDTLFLKPGSFVENMLAMINKGYFKLQDITWYGDKVMRTALATQFMKNGMDMPQAVKETQLAMAHYSRISTGARRMLSIPMMFATYRIQMLRLHKELVKHPWKYRNRIMASAAIRLGTASLMNHFGYKPMKSNLAKFFEAEGTSSDVIDLLTQYRFEKIDEKTGERKVVTTSGPVWEIDKFLNRSLGSILKYNAGVFPALWIQLTENRDFGNKPITEIGMNELISGMREKVYGKDELAKYIGQVGYFALRQYFPPIEEVGRIVADAKSVGAAKTILNFTAIAYSYNYTQSIKKLEKDITQAQKEGNNDEVQRLNGEIRRTKMVLQANQLVKNDKLDFDDAMTVVYLSQKPFLSLAEEAKLNRLIRRSK